MEERFLHIGLCELIIWIDQYVQGAHDGAHCQGGIQLERFVTNNLDIRTSLHEIVGNNRDIAVTPHENGYLVQWDSLCHQLIHLSYDELHGLLCIVILG